MSPASPTRPTAAATEPGPSRPRTATSARTINTKQQWPEFSADDLARFPALKKRNFFCVQRHQATAHHYDLRMQLDGGTFSWAIPKGLFGLNKADEATHIAVETTVHPIDYTLYEGNDGKTHASGKRLGTMLWDVGSYTIDHAGDPADEQDSQEDSRRKRRRIAADEDEDDDDPTGRHEEDKFRDRLQRRVGSHARTIHFTLSGGRKLTHHSYILVLTSTFDRKPSHTPSGRDKRNWLLKLPRHVSKYEWDRGGEDGPFYARSVKTDRMFQQVLSDPPEGGAAWQPDLRAFAEWTEKKRADEMPKKRVEGLQVVDLTQDDDN